MARSLIPISLLTFLLLGCASAPQSPYPVHWWTPVTDIKAPKWEILPQAGEKGRSVILSKRHELGVLSNFAATPIKFRGKSYPSLEGAWQAMKYPENTTDPRFRHPNVKWKFKRNQVEQMVGFEAKRAGSMASKNMQAMNINWVTFEGKRMPYRVSHRGEHYQVIRELMTAKLKQNPEVKRTLMATGDLILLPDHRTRSESPPAWRYNEIWMEIRDQVQRGEL